MIPNFTMKRMRIATVLFIVALVVVLTDAFISPTQQRVHQQHHYSYPPPTPSTTTLKALPEFIYNPSVMLSDGLSAATYMTTQDEFNSAMSAGNGPLGALRTFFIVITAAVFGITALVYLTAAFLVPRAAEQLEKDTKRLQPGLWEEYQEKLEDGETMVNRPELLQELGNIMQPIIAKDYEEQYKTNLESTTTPSVKDTSDSDEAKGGVIDAKIIEKADD